MSNRVQTVIKGLRLIRSGQGRSRMVANLTNRARSWQGPSLLDVGLDPEHVFSGSEPLPLPTHRPAPGTPLRVAWVTYPPGAGSGGHTTMFRMVEELEAAGHHCTVLIYHPSGADLEAHAAVVRRSWPTIRADFRSLPADLSGFDACIATAWQTAHTLARLGSGPTRRLYFVQDYEPLFYPRGSEMALAAASYGFGFRLIALGHMVAGHLRAAGHDPEVVPFGCDGATYHLTPGPDRSGVAFYAVPSAARRGFLLTLLALEEFHRTHPHVEIHAYGNAGRPLRFPFPVTWHGRLSPADLNGLYNRVVAGVGLSFTNISLVVEEMLAAGCIPVVNDDVDARADLPNDHVAWAAATPAGIAGALGRLTASGPDEIASRAVAAAASARPDWKPAREGVRHIVEREVYGC